MSSLPSQPLTTLSRELSRALRQFESGALPDKRCGCDSLPTCSRRSCSRKDCQEAYCGDSCALPSTCSIAASEESTAAASSQHGQASDHGTHVASEDNEAGNDSTLPIDAHECNEWLDNVQVPPPLQVSWSDATTTAGLAGSRMVGTPGAHVRQPGMGLGKLLPASTLVACSPEVARTSSLCAVPEGAAYFKDPCEEHVCRD
mmetsp:Transcript_137181/g.273731  ORF Transcript_137181/g.273731 Transcript_137181/m.273731 type:complete len:202 (-) Transcript_137181:214-819(-)